MVSLEVQHCFKAIAHHLVKSRASSRSIYESEGRFTDHGMSEVSEADELCGRSAFLYIYSLNLAVLVVSQHTMHAYFFERTILACYMTRTARLCRNFQN